MFENYTLNITTTYFKVPTTKPFHVHFQLNEALEAARTEVSRLHEERDRYEETMKKAFMRGVCALNMEAMNMFHEAEKEGTREDFINSL